MPGRFLLIQNYASARLLRIALPSVAALASLAGCSVNLIQPATPVANFGGAFTAVAGVRRTFNGSSSTDRESGPLTYHWNFGDGSTATGVSPNHTYAIVGAVVVSLTVTDTSNMSSTVTEKGAIAPGTPVANAGGPYSARLGTGINFEGGESTDPQGETLTYAWRFGDGSTAEVGSSPSHTYTMPGTYIVSLTVTDTSNLSATSTRNVMISPAPPFANSGGPYTSMAGKAVSLSGSTSSDPQGETLTYVWSFGDGSTNGTGVDPIHTYAAAGTYSVLLTVTNASDLNATTTTTTTVLIAPPSQSRVMAGSKPISNSSVELFAVGADAAFASLPLLTAPVITGPDGGFSIARLYTCPSPATQVYLAATGGNPGLTNATNNTSIALMAALGSCASFSASSALITIDEISTVEAVWPNSVYMSSISQVGADTRNLSNAFVDSANLASIVSGSPAYPGTMLADQDLTIRTLANSLDSCVSSEGDTYPGSPCALLFAAATPSGGTAPADTLSAARAIALNPASNVSAIYDLAASKPPFGPALTAPPIEWTLGLPHPAPATLSISLNRSSVFMGDSITYLWPMPTHNAGVGGQRAADMLSRFSSDVLGHGYGRVVILAGTNDIWSPTTQSGQALQQIEAMAATAGSAGIEVVLARFHP